MKLDNLVGERFRENPSECIISSHALMIRGGYMKNVANGIFSSFTPLKRITRKIENIIREEMDAIDGQEVAFPVVMPASLWQESGRYDSIGSELVRFHDRNKNPLVLGMTHEEAAVQLVREYGQSYSKYPFMIYQIQTKFRDEGRPRGGLIRVREFTMKDAYSFHTTQKDLEEYYLRCFKAYERIYARVGLPEVVSIAADSGIMGGNVSHEFMLLTPVGEDSIVICGGCDYRANLETAENIVENIRDDSSQPVSIQHTPGQKTIEDVCDYLNSSIEKSCKAVVYQKDFSGEYVVVFIRGDLDVNEKKLRNYLGEDIRVADMVDNDDLCSGYIGPLELKTKAIVLFDNSLMHMNNMVCGANKTDYHYTGIDTDRDLPDIQFHDFAKAFEGGICPECGKPMLKISRGIEVGNIFQLGTKYTEAMGMSYLDSDGQSKFPIMGCYGIGVGRLAASVCESHHDEHGPIWPISIAPWQVHICALRSDEAEVKQTADEIYRQLQENAVEVLYDDRQVSAGVMFSDADLLGIPIRLIISPRNMKSKICELVIRNENLRLSVPLDEITKKTKSVIDDLIKGLIPVI